ncbi:isoleucine--tRNA ligase [Candidatus Roizmanbacteria bacterium RIFCSPLOWO2_02_FULL_37_19]|uniref:Isoleucine--tRNA ligase n=1 Tax=Candidatus Roizmanbacteria bacterium RIFCSPHIGHO2_02_FULL_37_24 TaxID=1802037 RepID=A0A1F7H0R7_9BACT|nr:MAG: isoleucine--tRNA ligase [Candidatus Roizmanbacteria bacterium RIFCSPHIGHO2_01_FULL_38_41]OGK24436.1 MAG: isoleucine--tRNA ligase [Candidatus Roizmanbacteria bacterium RIFCSPHIGHO2_02_FULL_37_24]OGK32650.1 MAG: isoleucine--tRNA ligase [Candidatus Roizmanbacteria bacterium RIFCSPHIGHO2_12_FULL_37_23]OGK44784.1 MAG: isoleucine--tRNA ligase [Candidatus Roizmanbacteria bacterium RIFCSPLOWO2_01_FULL_37_57]OGK53964.1 MAG: isoleucine--tRNA ligase [Candidatus Roizmanbacteria bacterium RIFCSPLOWO
MFKPIDPKPDFAKIEQEILHFWKDNNIFEKSIESKPPSKTWTFLDGPPFITGLPHYGSLLSCIPKDVFPRFWTMKGYRVRRVWGWDCHGLPAENKVENKLGLKRKKDIEETIGIKKFIDECKLYVGDVSSEWEWYVDHIGRWVDFKNAYKTMDKEYMESVMWVFKQMYDKGQIYKGLRVSLFCPHCSTPISNFEVAMDSENYKQITDLGTIYKYKLTNYENTYILAWSTTPWNKIVTPALAVNPVLTYVTVEIENEKYILAQSTIKILDGLKYKILDTFKGEKIIGEFFEPHYTFYTIEKDKKAFIIIGGDFVTADEGTGVVTLAAYGEEDLEVMTKENIQIVLHVDEEGNILDHVPQFGGMFYLDANEAVNDDLRKRGLILKEEPYTYSMPHCWRCGTQLFYAPQNAWFVNIQDIKKELFKTNEAINWYPNHFKQGRFKKSMEAAPDWCISRSRYWGSPVPVWECSCGERFVPGSIKELEEASGQKVVELHKPDIDEIFVTCKRCGKKAKRVPEVLDSWIEAGSAPYAERHYPFNKKEKLGDFFPPDFIVEYTGQIRAWFYVLHVISNVLFNSHAFKNVVVTGVILGSDGRKMSKNYGNYPDPRMMLEKYGGDALRIYLMGSSVMRGEDILISEEEYREQLRGLLLPLWNTYNFFTTYALLHKWTPSPNLSKPSTNVLDMWIVSRLHNTIQSIKTALEAYDTVSAVGYTKHFLNNDLSGWYIRRIRDRVRADAENKEDISMTLNTLWYVLVEYLKALAPLAPFITEAIFKNITSESSIHLQDWPKEGRTDDKLEQEMKNAIELSSAIHALRKEAGIKVRIPLREVEYKGPIKFSDLIVRVVLDEINAYELKYTGKAKDIQSRFDTHDNNLDREAGDAREIIRTIQVERKKIGLHPSDQVIVTIPSYPAKYKDLIMKKVAAKEIRKGDKLVIEKI